MKTRSASTSEPASVPLPGALPPNLARRLSEARAVARERGLPIYLVGGAVRDLLLGRPVEDLDLSVAGDAQGFARELARRLRGRSRRHDRFRTVIVEAPDGSRIDVATLRSEEYETPGALPRVRPGTLQDDLARRDFTINAMAVDVGAGRPRLFDPFGGKADLRCGIVRMLHERSPFDDPTRAFRAVSFANRLGFAIESRTRHWIRDAIGRGALDTISADRLRREIEYLFSEEDRAAAARGLAPLGLDRAVHPALRFDALARRRLGAVEKLSAGSDAPASWLAYLLAGMGETTARDAERIAARLNLTGAAGAIVRRWPQTWSMAGEAIERLSDDEALALASRMPLPSARRFLVGRREARRLRLTIRGRDLVAAGVPPGPAIGRALTATLDARREGTIAAEEELAFALEAARS